MHGSLQAACPPGPDARPARAQVPLARQILQRSEQGLPLHRVPA